MPTAAIYARYSSDLQNDRSCEDQIRLCREFASRNGYSVADGAVYQDAAKSGASLFGRDGVLDMVEMSASGKFQMVIVESLDRLSRDQEDLAKLYKRLSFRGIKIMQVHGGHADEIQVGVRGLLGALYLKDLADKTRRGLAGKVAKGQSAGGKAYGYRPVKGEPGNLEIVEDEAEIVRRIFELYAGGASARQIATGLNKDGVLAPRGAHWAANTLSGDPKKGTGILRVSLYHGEMIWNKMHYVKDPDTGRRISRVNPPEDWQHIDVPDLRIVDEKVWIAVQNRLEGGRRGGKGIVRKQRLLSGLVKCGVCGAGMTVSGTSRGEPRITCVRHKEGGSCTHNRAYNLSTVEDAVIQSFRTVLEEPEAMKAKIDLMVQERRRKISGMAKVRGKAEDEVARANAAHDRLLECYIWGKIGKEEFLAKSQPAEERLKAAKAALAEIEKPPVVDLHAEAVDDYKRMLDNMAILLKHGAEKSAAFGNAVRDQLHSVIVYETVAGAPMRIEVRGKLYGLTGDTVAKVMVAGAGFEPAAFRL
jgi:site-specific DNA recombinase